jgi:tRNA (uracil-5-)-methyltransferase
MNCKYFGSCGSCGLYGLKYFQQLKYKEDLVSKLLSPYYKDSLEVFDSLSSHYRARAEFRIWHSGERCDYAMGNITKDGVVNISECPKVIYAIESRMWRLLKEINSSQILKRKLFSIEFLATTTDECLITMLYHRKLDDDWIEIAKELEILLGCKIMGRSRKQKVVISDEYVVERLSIDSRNIVYKEYEGGFTQPNPNVNVKMIEWAISQAKKIDRGDLLESYCGLGNFTIPLSFYFDNVLATEVSKRSIYAAQNNCIQNSVDNISFARLSSEEMTKAINGIRKFTRLEGIDLNSYNFSTVLVDPPRAGLDNDTIELISNIEYIIYISCNPKTLARDLEILSKTHQVDKVAIFDQFPYTPHIESGVFLKKLITS